MFSSLRLVSFLIPFLTSGLGVITLHFAFIELPSSLSLFIVTFSVSIQRQSELDSLLSDSVPKM